MNGRGVTTTSNRLERFSFFFMGGVLLLVILLKLGVPVLGIMFSFLALSTFKPRCRGGKAMAVAVYLILFAGIAYGLGHFVNLTVRALPAIAEKAIPSIIEWARQRQIELPFTDYDSLRDLALDAVKGEVSYLGSFAKVARGATTEFVFLVAGCVIAISLFLNSRFELSREANSGEDNLYSRACKRISERFATLYQCFVTVMGAQVIISGINTTLTGIFMVATHLPYAIVVLGVTFLCGILPVVGNLLSNAIVVGIGFTVSPRMALIALIFLIVVHKLEYFLNSKIVGWRIRNPLWLTLIGLIIGERLMGVAGMILAPVVLNYIKVEASRFRDVSDPASADCATNRRA